MTGKPLDPEQAIRDWLAESVPSQLPASLKEALEEATSRPAGRVEPWSGASSHRLRWAGRVAAVAAVLAIAVSGLYLFGHGRTALPGTSPSASPGATGSPDGRPSPEPATSSPWPEPTVVALPGSTWRLASAFPALVAPDSEPYRSPVFALASGGFVAFVPTASGQSSAYQSSDARPMAFRTEGPTRTPVSSWETRVYGSFDGAHWIGQSVLPGNTATAWTSSDGQTWSAVAMPGSNGVEAVGVVHGPAGFLAWANGPTSTLMWASGDGTSWRRLETSGLPAEVGPDCLFSVGDGWAAAISGDKAQVWQSTDGARWTLAWQGPAATSPVEGYYMGPIAESPDGGYVSFGEATQGGGPLEFPSDIQIWTSKDLLHWTRASRVPRPGWVDDFTAFPSGYVAAGQTVSQNGGEPSQYGSLGVWVSEDGESWRPLAGLPSIAMVDVLSVVGDGASVVVTFVDSSGNLQMLAGHESK